MRPPNVDAPDSSSHPAAEAPRGPSDAGKAPAPSWPAFLSDLDRDPSKARGEFYGFVTEFFAASPPHRFRGLAREDREDIVQEIYIACIERDFRRLRAYIDRGVPFAAWFARLAANWIADWSERRRRCSRIERPDPVREEGAPSQEFPDPARRADDLLLDREVVEVVRACFEKLDAAGKLLIVAALEGRSPREMALLLAWSPDRNKEASDMLRHRRRLLARWVRERGIDVSGRLGRGVRR